MNIRQIPITALHEVDNSFSVAIGFHADFSADPNSCPVVFASMLDGLQILSRQDYGYPYIHCGSTTTTARAFGLEFVSKLVGQVGLPDTRFEASVQAAYGIVLSRREPQAHYIQSSINILGKRHDVSYYRLLFPMKFGLGVTLGCVTQFDGDLDISIDALPSGTSKLYNH